MATFSLTDLAATPWLWFLLIAILPGVGIPNCPLMIACGSLLTAKYGIEGAVLVAVAAVNANILWTYWVAAQPWSERFQQSVERRTRACLGDEFQLNQRSVFWITFLLHITPGVPLFVQNYFPGLNRLAFWKYLAIAVPIQSLYTSLIVATSGQCFAMLKNYPLAIAGILVAIAAFAFVRKKSPTAAASAASESAA